MKFVGVKLLYDRFFDRVFYHTYDSVLIDLNIFGIVRSRAIFEKNNFRRAILNFVVGKTIDSFAR